MAFDSTRTIRLRYNLDTGRAISNTIHLQSTTERLGGALRVVSKNYKTLDGDLVRHTRHIWADERAVTAYNRALAQQVRAKKISIAQFRDELAVLGQVHRRRVQVTRATIASQRKGGLFGTGDKPGMILAKVASWTVATGAIFGTIGALKKGIQTITEFDSGMVGLQKVFQGTSAELGILKQDILNVSVEMGSLTQTTLGAAVELGRMGKNRAEISELMRVALLAQNVAEIDAADGVKLLNAAILQFDKSAEDAITILDKWNTLSNKTPVETKAMAAAVSIAGAVFHQAGADIEDLNAYVTTLTATMAKSGNEIGTALKTIASYAFRGKTVAKIFELTGIAVKKQTGELMDLDVLLAKLSASWTTLTEAQQEELAMSVAGVRRKGFFLNLMENFNMTIDAQALQWDAAGSSMRENAIRMESLKTKTTQLSAAFEKMAVSTGDAGVLGGLKAMTDGMIKLVLNLEQASTAMSLLGGAMLVGVIGLNKMAVAKVAAATAAGKLTLGIRALNSVMLRWTVLLGIAFYAFNKLVAWTSRHERALKEQKDAIDKSIVGIRKQKSEQEGLMSAYEQYNAVFEEYLSLEAKKKDTSEIEARLDYILGKINEKFPEATKNVDDHTTAIKNMAEAYREAAAKLVDLDKLGIKTRMRSDELAIVNERIGLAEDIKKLGSFGGDAQKQYDFLGAAEKGQKALLKLKEEWVEESKSVHGENFDDVMAYIDLLDGVLNRYIAIADYVKQTQFAERYISQYDELDARKKARRDEINKISKSGKSEVEISKETFAFAVDELGKLNDLEDSEIRYLEDLRDHHKGILKGFEARKKANDEEIRQLREELELTKQRAKSEKDALTFMLTIRKKLADKVLADPQDYDLQQELRKFDVEIDEQRFKVAQEREKEQKKNAEELTKLQKNLNKHLAKKLTLAGQINAKEQELFVLLNKENKVEKDIWKITELVYDIAKLEADLKAEMVKDEQKITAEKVRQLNTQIRLQERLVQIQRASDLMGASDKFIIQSIQAQADIDKNLLGTDGKPLTSVERQNIQLKADILIETIRLENKSAVDDLVYSIADSLGDSLEDAIIMSISKGFSSSERNAPWNSFVTYLGRDIGDMVSTEVGKAITTSMMVNGVATLGGRIAGAAGGAIVGAVVSAGISLIANKLFPTDKKDEKVEAIDENTQSLNALTDEMKKSNERYINAPSTFALGAVSGEAPQAAGGARLLTPGYVYGHAGEVIGQPDQFQYHNSNNVSNVVTNDIKIYTQPGQNANEIADLVTKKIVGSYSRGGHYSSKI